MHTEQTENELIIKESPGCLWIVGLFFAFVGGVFVYGALGGLADYARQSPLMLALALLMGSCGVAAGVWIIYRAPITKVVVDRIEETVSMTRYGLFGRQQTFYHFDEIERFCLVEEMDDENSPVWSFGMKLTTGETLKITSLASHFEEYERKYIFQANEFIGKQIPPAQMILEFDEDHDSVH